MIDSFVRVTEGLLDELVDALLTAAP